MHRRPSLYLVASAAAVAGIVALALHTAHAPKAPAETESALRAALAANPNDSLAMGRLAQLLALDGKNAEAIALYQKVIQRTPDNAAAPVSLALLLDKSGQSTEAENLLQANLNRHPGDAATSEALADTAIHALGDMGPLAYPKVKPLYEAAVKSDPARASAALSLAKIDLAQGDIAAAKETLEHALLAPANERNAQLHLAYARLLALLGDYAAASPHFDTGTALDPANAQAFCDWGVMLIDAGKPELADKVLRHAVDLSPATAAYHMHLGRALRDEQQFTGSRDEFAAAIRADSHYAPTYLEVSRSLITLHQEQPAIAYLRSALKEDPHFVEAKVALAKVYSNPADEADRDLWGAANLLREAVEDTRGQDISLLVGAARALSAVNANDQALAQIEAALALAGARHLSAPQREVLLGLRQDYLIATLPPAAEALPSYLSTQALGGDPLAEPAPKMPAFSDQFWRPMDITRPPGPGSVLDPDLFIQAAGAPEQGNLAQRAGAAP